MKIDDINLFVAVYRAGHIAPVARSKGVAPSSVSRAISKLESALGVRLFNRSTRQLSPTQAGEDFFNAVSPVLESLDDILRSASAQAQVPKGALKVGASVAFGQLQLLPRLPEFQSLFPDILLELMLDDRRSDVVADQLDIVFRHGPLEDSHFVCRKVRDVRYTLVASPGYLAGRGMPRTVADLQSHRLLTFGFAPFRDQWRISENRRERTLAVDPAMRASNALALLDAAKLGLGIALLADWTVSQALHDGALTAVLPDCQPLGAVDDPAIWAIYPSRSFLPAKTRAFLDFMSAGAYS